LAGFEAALHLVDHVDPALAADQTVVAVATTQRFQRVTDLHGSNPDVSKGRVGPSSFTHAKFHKDLKSGKMGFIPPAALLPGTRAF
jgi:hypothetical protein